MARSHGLVPSNTLAVTIVSRFHAALCSSDNRHGVGVLHRTGAS
jgi:hypothetical protein